MADEHINTLAEILRITTEMDSESFTGAVVDAYKRTQTRFANEPEPSIDDINNMLDFVREAVARLAALELLLRGRVYVAGWDSDDWPQLEATAVGHRVLQETFRETR